MPDNKERRTEARLGPDLQWEARVVEGDETIAEGLLPASSREEAIVNAERAAARRDYYEENKDWKQRPGPVGSHPSRSVGPVVCSIRTSRTDLSRHPGLITGVW